MDMWCCVCRKKILRGKHRMWCTKCENVAHRVCLPSVASENLKDFKASWMCRRCKDGGQRPQEGDNTCKDEGECDGDFDDTISIWATAGRKQFAHLNINGVGSKKKFTEVRDILANYANLMVLAVTESRLGKKADGDFTIRGYQVVRIDRRGGKAGGGQLLYKHNSCSFKMIELPLPGHPELTPPGLVECNILNVSSKKGIPVANVCAMYVPPRDATKNKTFSFFSAVSKYLTSFGKMVIIMGDFNVNWEKETSSKRKLDGIVEEFQLAQIIDTPTRPKSGTLIDHIYIQQKNLSTAAGSVDANASSSDHSMVIVEFT